MWTTKCVGSLIDSLTYLKKSMNNKFYITAKHFSTPRKITADKDK